MGINHGYDVCDFFLTNSELRNNSTNPKLKCNIYIDGYVLWRSGTIPGTDLIDENIVEGNIEGIRQYIMSTGNFDVQSTFIYFDGQPPKLKRSDNLGFIYPDSQLGRWIEKVRGSGYPGEIVLLEKGEAEIQCFLQRDRSIASIICTSDSDALHICYNDNSQRRSDRVFFYRLNYQHRECEKLYDTNLFTTKFNKNAFTLLLYLLGDKNYIKSLFTPSMVKKIFELLNEPTYADIFNRINTTMNELKLNIDNIEKCIAFFIRLLCDARKNKISQGKKRDTVSWPQSNTIMSTGNYIHVLRWMIMYSSMGSNVEYYDNFELIEPVGVEEITNLKYIYRLCVRVFPLDDNVIQDFKKEIEHHMNNVAIDRLN
ncbi:GSCOCT00014064001.2-RA-CDS [Cotesia congregata]|uniref:Cc_fen1_3b n=1 Tax=Cotesia congregata TaxID=51543 RepID=A0A8J2HL50_COTCN|nr:GSCOCT00014064001.2-RA-CDS [Cotesia congregata]CAG5095878.1 Cc_fen1_3b [Cotesia congregata]